MSARRTYWHLESLGRKPTEYEITSSQLLYYPRRGIEVTTPLAEIMNDRDAAGGLRCADFERFADPRQTTYTRYIAERRDQEMFVDRLLSSIDGTDHEARLSSAWIAVIDRVLGPLRYPVHGLQMLAAHAGAMAPSGKLVICCLLQAADETRRVQRLAYRLRQVQEVHPRCGTNSKLSWQSDPRLQPLREVIEKLFLLRNFGELFSIVNLVVKPMFDELFLLELGQLARSANDDATHGVLRSLYEDCLWHRQWSAALVSMLLADDAQNARTIVELAAPWRPRMREAIGAVVALLSELTARDQPELDQACQRIENTVSGYFASMGLGDAREGNPS